MQYDLTVVPVALGDDAGVILIVKVNVGAATEPNVILEFTACAVTVVVPSERVNVAASPESVVLLRTTSTAVTVPVTLRE
jgi:hypothetical protein